MKDIYIRKRLRETLHQGKADTNSNTKKHCVQLDYCVDTKKESCVMEHNCLSYFSQANNKFDAILNEILNWNIFNLKSTQLYNSELEKIAIPANFENEKESFTPLVLEECRSHILQSIDRKLQQCSIKILDMCRSSNFTSILVENICLDSDQHKQMGALQPYDLVALLPRSAYCNDNFMNELNKSNGFDYILAFVENEFRNNSTNWSLRLPSIKINTFSGLKSNLNQSLTINSTWKLYHLSSLLTIAREIQSLFYTSVCHLFPIILNPVKYWESNFKTFITHDDITLIKPQLKSLLKLNETQIEAISLSLCEPKNIALIQGPPGTGKTTTIQAILNIIMHFANVKEQRQRVLICAPSNAAVDEIASRTLIHGFKNLSSTGDSEKIIPLGVRLGNESRITNPEIKKFLLSSLLVNDYQNTASDHLSMSSLQTSNIAHDYKDVQLLLSPESKKKNKTTIETKTNMDNSSLLDSCDLVFSTLSSSAAEILSSFSPINYVIIDEATQAVELSSLIPLRWKPNHIIMIGDPQQLPATVKSNLAKKLAYERSLFERLMQCGMKVQRLNIQYRMRSEIAKFPTYFFYENNLITPRSVAQRENLPFHTWTQLFGPLLFFNVPSFEKKSALTLSYSNREEAIFIIGLVKLLIKNYIKNEKTPVVSIKDVAVITPYKEQVHCITDMLLAQVTDKWKDELEICTIDSFQGREKRIIIFSCVRSNSSFGSKQANQSLGFVTDSRRLNVAITRAQDSLWIVGCAVRLSRNIMWQSFIEHAKSCRPLLKDSIDDSGSSLIELFDESIIPSFKLSAFVDISLYSKIFAQEFSADIENASNDYIIAFFLSSCEKVYKFKT